MIDLLISFRSIELLVSISMLIQTLEFLNSRFLNFVGLIWDSKSLLMEYGESGRGFQWVFRPISWKALLYFRLVFSMGLFLGLAGPWMLSAGLVIQFFLLLRFRGNFNGGSDFMTTLFLMGLFLSKVFPLSSGIPKWVLMYLGVQVLFSYFIAGLVKLKEPKWRSGTAVAHFLTSSPYHHPHLEKIARTHEGLLRWAGVMTLVFELSAPFVLMGRSFALAFCFVGFGFHLLVFFSFGLNRFFWAWLAGYPALFYLSGLLNR